MSATTLTIHLLVLLAFAILCHGVIVFNDTLYWDGWLVDSWQRRRSWPVMRRFYSEVGMPLLYYLHRALSYLPNRILAYRCIAFAATFLGAVAVYLLSLRLAFLNDGQSLLLALMYLAYTGYHMNVDTVVGVQYTLPTALFYWAALLAFVAQDQVGPAYWTLRILALALFFLSFNANSLLLYYFGFLAVKLLLPVWSSAAGWIAIYQEARSNVDFILLPFAYWVLKNALTPRHGHYVQYNRIRIDVLFILYGLFNSIRHGLEAPLTAPLRAAGARGLLSVPAAAFALTYAVLSYTATDIVAWDQSVALGCLALGALLFLLAALPYPLVGHQFFSQGWNTRLHMLFHLPVALITLGLGALVFSEYAFIAAAAAMLTANAIYLNLMYLHHLAVGLKNRSWLRKLAQAPQAKAASIILLTDQHSLRGDPMNAEQEHRPAYLFYMFEAAWGDKQRCGFPVSGLLSRRIEVAEITEQMVATTLDYDMRAVDVEGAQLQVIVSDGKDNMATRLALRYLRARYLLRGDIGAMLEKVTEVRLVAI